MQLDPKLAEKIRLALDTVAKRSENAIEGHLNLRLEQAQEGKIVFAAETAPWMCNIDGVIHGGICALLVDECMGCVANSMIESAQITPTIQMQLHYHRPLLAGSAMRIEIQPVSITTHLIHLNGQVYQQTDRPCVSTTATFFCK